MDGPAPPDQPHHRLHNATRPVGSTAAPLTRNSVSVSVSPTANIHGFDTPCQLAPPPTKRHKHQDKAPKDHAEA